MSNSHKNNTSKPSSAVKNAQSIPAQDLLDAMTHAGVQDVVMVPDTHQRCLIDLLDEKLEPRVIRVCTEDEGVALCAGLITGGRFPILQIQHAGLYACVNNLRGIAMDGEMPLVMLVGLLGRDLARTPRDNFGSMVRLAEPLLDTLGIPYILLDGPDDLPQLADTLASFANRDGPVAILIGAEPS
ncbi:MAG: hypothetical protein KUG79_17945 [Pseudomonadales bacterium]|nr:hypothetical protein [Pseudomonadales bacterium]